MCNLGVYRIGRDSLCIALDALVSGLQFNLYLAKVLFSIFKNEKGYAICALCAEGNEHLSSNAFNYALRNYGEGTMNGCNQE